MSQRPSNASLDNLNEDIFGMLPNAFHLGGTNPSTDEFDKIESEHNKHNIGTSSAKDIISNSKDTKDARIMGDYLLQLSAMQKKEESKQNISQVSTESGDAATPQGAEVSTHNGDDYVTKASIEKRIREVNAYVDQSRNANQFIPLNMTQMSLPNNFHQAFPSHSSLLSFFGQNQNPVTLPAPQVNPMPLFAQLLGQQAVQNLSLSKEQNANSIPLQLMVQNQYVQYPTQGVNSSSQPYDELLDQLSNKSPIKDEYLDVTPFISMSQEDAARKLGIPSSTLSKRWREATMNRKWPYRNICKIDREIKTMVANIQNGKNDPEMQMTLGNLIKKRKEETRTVFIKRSMLK